MKSVNTVNAIDNVAKSLANTKPVTNALSLSNDSKRLVVGYAKVFNQETEVKGLLVDSLFADGFRAYHIVGATDEDKSLLALRNQIIQLIVSADPEDAKLYNAEPKTLSIKMQAVQTTLKTRTVPTIISNIKIICCTINAELLMINPFMEIQNITNLEVVICTEKALGLSTDLDML